ncbi:MAG: DEAD/DEAH box helicase [bacterium]
MNDITFKDLGFSEDILEALAKKGFEAPTEIQASVAPVILKKDCDLMGQAQTGTGKTAAFGMPILDLLTPSKDGVQALILTPTRELTIQVSDELHALKGKKKLRITPVYGGQSIEKQRSQLRQANDIIVGTPGRLIDHLKGKALKLTSLKYLVIDEADEMLNGGFIEDLEWILAQLNSQRRTFLFSATMPPIVLNLAKKFMKDFDTIKTKKETLETSLTEQLYFEVRESDKLEALCRIIDVEDDFYGLVFCRTKRDVDMVSEKLITRGYDVEAMHGDLSQFQRERVLHKFRKKVCQVLVVTDVASRGLDISGLSHVINFALPQDAESYVHRVGRTGRAGQSGTAITFVTPQEYRKMTYIKKVSKAEIKKADIPSVQHLVETKKKRLKCSIQQMIEQDVEEVYVSFAEALLSTYNPKEALAGVLKVAFEEEFSEEQYQHIKAVPSASFDRGQGRHAKGGRQRDGGRRRGDRSFVDVKGQMRLFVAKGRLDKMDKGKLVAYLSKQSGVSGSAIQGVDVFDKFSFVTAAYQDADQILKSFKPKDRKQRSVVVKAK